MVMLFKSCSSALCVVCELCSLFCEVGDKLMGTPEA